MQSVRLTVVAPDMLCETLCHCHRREVLLWVEEILHQLIGGLSHYL
jgi:hypothetical protein